MQEGRSYGFESKEKAAFARGCNPSRKGFLKQSVPLRGNILLGGGGGGGQITKGSCGGARFLTAPSCPTQARLVFPLSRQGDPLWKALRRAGLTPPHGDKRVQPGEKET